ncbi:hypothetical protein NW752_001614 [Fusarium irregulare]|uniref:Uncharacterized protein n=1 Tax=Fusarium irregulare TaxID=2494466 RepID=A0A9W8UAP6_9HYPO|nr:hypothetical protein NW766_003773 [Fusarium irregulare]KAJ4026660.1 hypothetical protein NW752_001614 [Fusarium irregulare]
MTSSEDYSGDTIPEIKSDAYTISGEIDDPDWTFPSENHEQTIDSLTAQIDWLKRQVENLKAYKDIALDARNSLDSIADNTKNALGCWTGGSHESYRKLVQLDAQAQGFKEVCHRKMDKAASGTSRELRSQRAK